MRPSSFLAGVMTILLMSSCANDDPISNPSTDFTGDYDPAFTLVEAFAGKVEGQKETSTKLNFKEKRIKKYKLSDYTPADKALSRSASDDNLTISTVIFDNDDSPGFAIVGESETLTKLYFYTDNGTPEGIREVEPAMQIIESIPSYFAADVTAASIIDGPIKPGIYPPLDSIAGWAIIGPITTTQWGQDAPYNTLAPVCDDPTCKKYGQHMPIGCGAVALGQFFANQGKYISSDGTVYDLSIVGKKASPSTQLEQDLVNRVLYHLATDLSMHYNCSTSTTYFSYAPPILWDNGYEANFVHDKIDDKTLVNELKNGYPHLIRGTRYNTENEDKESNGHMWIIDGIYGPLDNPYYHCNWGWGGKGDCWTISAPFKGEGVKNYYDTGFFQIYVSK